LLNDYTGSKTALLMAQISSSSGVVGGAAWAINRAYDIALPGYPSGGVATFSREIAKGDLDSIVQLDPANPSLFKVPDDQ
jgi:hypothetical protein